MNKNKLHNIKDSGFKTPKNYFDGLEDSIMSQINLNENVKDTGFKVPVDYFETLDDKILDKVVQKPKVISLFTRRNLLYATGIAAALILMFNIIGNNNDFTFDDLELASIENYLFTEDIDTYEIASLLIEEELTTDNFTENQISGEILEDYLLENAIIEDLIIE
ncbi:MAG: hypothetical protein HKO81_09905 [Flavobacteriaceae bacterium]|nr:hypothetical protein [Bacteroidia bacterium]NNL16939.1 hypothetical protein [Flavobacteriaceae bacterium]